MAFRIEALEPVNVAGPGGSKAYDAFPKPKSLIDDMWSGIEVVITGLTRNHVISPQK